MRRSLGIAALILAVLTSLVWLISRLLLHTSSQVNGGFFLVGAVLVSVAAVMGGFKDTVELVQSLRATSQLPKLSPDPGGVRLAQMAIDEGRCVYEMHRYDPSRGFFEMDEVVIIRGVVPTPKGAFGSVEEFKAYRQAREVHLNHDYFRWLEEYGLSPSEVPIVVTKHEERVAKSWEERYPEFLISIANDSALQVVLSEIEVRVDLVIGIRSADKSEVLHPLDTYAIAMEAAIGRYAHDMVPPIKIAPHDSASFAIRLLPKRATGMPTGKVLIASLGVRANGKIISTPHFMLEFYDSITDHADLES